VMTATRKPPRIRPVWPEDDLPYYRHGDLVCPRCKKPLMVYRKGGSPRPWMELANDLDVRPGERRVYRCKACEVRYPRVQSLSWSKGMRRTVYALLFAWWLSRLLGGV